MFKFITNYLEPFACLLYMVAIVIYNTGKKNRGTYFLLIYYTLTGVLLLAAALSVRTTENNNIWMYDSVALLTTLFIGIYFYRLLQSPLKKKAVLLLIAIHLVYLLIRNLTLNEERLFDSIGYAILSASIAAYVFMYFNQVLKKVTEANILREFNFWLASGYLIYFVGSFFIFVSYYYFTTKILTTYTAEERDLLSALWGLHNVLLFLSAFSLLIGSIWITYRRK